MLILNLYDPVTKSSIPIQQKLDGGGFFHINHKHPLFNELQFLGKIHDVPFRASGRKELDPFDHVWVTVTCCKIIFRDEHNLRVGGLFFNHWKDNFDFVQQMRRRQKLYQIQENKNGRV